jgi:ABC-type branched-subunit amino acid transport system ATPase component/ABC-type branched-subunit amino acid transport system permease subunit
VVALAIPHLVGTDDYQLTRFEYIATFVMIAVGLDVVTGFAGQMSLGPGAIFALAGYSTAIYADNHPTASLLILCAIAVAVALVSGVIIGLLALRVSGFYLGMTTLFVALLVPAVASHLDVTGGNVGISLLANLDFVQSPSGLNLYNVVIAALCVMVLLALAILHSSLGRRMLAVRTSDELAQSLGISSYRTKLVAFAISAVPAGLGGAMFVYTQQGMTPDSVTANHSIYLIAGCAIGGFGSVYGSIVGSAGIFSLVVFSSALEQYQTIVFGLALLVIISLLPDGLFGAGTRGAVLMRLASILSLVRRQAPSAPTTSASDTDLHVRLPSESDQRAAFGWATAARQPLVVTGVSRSFGGVKAVDDVDVEVRPGTVHALIGPNGSGKTTLLNLISGAYRLDSGTVKIGDQRLDGHGRSFVARRGVSRTFQTPKLLYDKDVLFNVLLAAERSSRSTSLESVLRLPRGRRSHSTAVDFAHMCLTEVGLDHLHDRPSAGMPHGMQRLIEVARGVAMRPNFLLLDEPAAGLSSHEVEVMKQVIKGLAAAGVGVLLIEHNLPLVLSLADEITVLHRGKKIAFGTPDEIAANDEVVRVYVGRAPGSSVEGGSHHG